MDYLPPQEIRCIAVAMYEEARGEPKLGQLAVGHVILNRSKKLKKTPCQVINQPGQFHFRTKARYGGEPWNTIKNLAGSLGQDPTGGALYFHNTKARPGWKYKLTVRIGNHVFYK